jgi:hypothetical protein
MQLAMEEGFTLADYGYPSGTGPITILIDAPPGNCRVGLAGAAPASIRRSAMHVGWMFR